MDNRASPVRLMPYIIKPWIRRLLVAVAILVMPLQAVAIATTFVQCHEQAVASIVAHDHQHERGATHHHDSSEEGTPGTTPGQHLCGHFVLHAPVSFNVGTQPQFPDWSAAAAFSYTPHVPEHPRRPPRG